MGHGGAEEREGKVVGLQPMLVPTASVIRFKRGGGGRLSFLRGMIRKDFGKSRFYLREKEERAYR